MTFDYSHSVKEVPTAAITGFGAGRSLGVDRVHFEELLKANLSAVEVAAVLGCGVEAVERFSQETLGLPFDKAQAIARTRVKVMLVKRALAKAMEGESSMIQLCLQNLCGWDIEEARPVSRNSFSKRKGGRSAKPGHGQGTLPGLLD